MATGRQVHGAFSSRTEWRGRAMTFIRKRRAGLLAGAVPAALAFAWPSGAGAQGAVGDFRLPPASSSPAPPAGPVDPEHPVVLPPQPGEAPGRPAAPAAPPPSPSPAPRASPAPQPAPREVTAPSPRAEAAASRAGAPEDTSVENLPAGPAESGAAPAPPPAAPQLPAEPPEREAGADASAAFPWPIALAALAALLALGAILLIRRRRRSPGPADEAASAEAAVETAPSPMAAAPVAAPAPPPPAPPPPPAAPATGGAAPLTVVGMRFEPRELRLSLVYATLAYEIVLTNLGRAPCGPLRLVGDMISAHASLGSAVQLAPDALQPLHDAAHLAPSDTLALRGQLRLPLSDVRVIGDARQAMFIPLVRLRLEMEDSGQTVAPTRVFAVGRAAPGAQAQLAPVRLDLGPRAIDDLGMLEIQVDKWLPADALRRAAG